MDYSFKIIREVWGKGKRGNGLDVRGNLACGHDCIGEIPGLNHVNIGFSV